MVLYNDYLHCAQMTLDQHFQSGSVPDPAPRCNNPVCSLCRERIQWTIKAGEQIINSNLPSIRDYICPGLGKGPVASVQSHHTMDMTCSNQAEKCPPKDYHSDEHLISHPAWCQLH